MCLDFNWLERIVLPAINKFYKTPEDRALIMRPNSRGQNIGLAERNIVSNIFYYMKRFLVRNQEIGVIPQYLSIDNEYNRNYDNPKSAYVKDKCGSCNKNDCIAKQISMGNEKKDMIPDIIVHKRYSNENNLVVIEFKKISNTDNEARDDDFAKLTYFTCKEPFGNGSERKEETNYKYDLGYFIDLGVDSYEITTFKDGILVKEQSYPLNE